MGKQTVFIPKMEAFSTTSMAGRLGKKSKHFTGRKKPFFIEYMLDDLIPPQPEKGKATGMIDQSVGGGPLKYGVV